MSLLLASLGRSWPYLFSVGLGAGLSGWAVHSLDTARYDIYQAQVQNERAKEANAAASALQDQINTRLATETRNATILSQLQSERDTAIADRDVVARLLSAAQIRATSHPVSRALDRSNPHDSTPASSDRSTPDLVGLTADAVGEFRDCLQRYSALQAELAPQLKH